MPDPEEDDKPECGFCGKELDSENDLEMDTERCFDCWGGGYKDV